MDHEVTMARPLKAVFDQLAAPLRRWPHPARHARLRGVL